MAEVSVEIDIDDYLDEASSVAMKAELCRREIPEDYLRGGATLADFYRLAEHISAGNAREAIFLIEKITGGEINAVSFMSRHNIAA